MTAPYPPICDVREVNHRKYSEVAMRLTEFLRKGSSAAHAERLVNELRGRRSDGANNSSVKERFEHLAQRWRTETDGYSMVRKKIQHHDYQEIIGELGYQAVPLILRELKLRGGHWYHALSLLTAENPIPPELAGDVPAMRECWLQWGRSRGLVDSE